MLRSSRCDVGEGPCSFKLRTRASVSLIRVKKDIETHLEHRIASLKELDEAGDDSTFDDTLDRGVLLLGQELAESGSRVELTLRIVRENASNHLIGELHEN